MGFSHSFQGPHDFVNFKSKNKSLKSVSWCQKCILLLISFPKMYTKMNFTLMVQKLLNIFLQSKRLHHPETEQRKNSNTLDTGLITK